MTTPREIIERAQREMWAICSGKRRWTMCVPVQADDSDEVIGAGLKTGLDAIATLDAARAELTALRNNMHEHCICKLALAGQPAGEPGAERCGPDTSPATMCPHSPPCQFRPAYPTGEPSRMGVTGLVVVDKTQPAPARAGREEWADAIERGWREANDGYGLFNVTRRAAEVAADAVLAALEAGR